MQIFPETIDKLPCSNSDKHGCLPQILPVRSHEGLTRIPVPAAIN